MNARFEHPRVVQLRLELNAMVSLARSQWRRALKRKAWARAAEKANDYATYRMMTDQAKAIAQDALWNLDHARIRRGEIERITRNTNGGTHAPQDHARI